MGWTHHWQRPTALPEAPFANFLSDVRQLIDSAANIVGGPDGTGQPIIVAGEIAFNGTSPFSCEPFEFKRVEGDRRGGDRTWSFCKTEHLPYDVIVQAVLIVAKHHLGDLIMIGSDGANADWTDARNLVATTLGYGFDFVLDGAEER